MSTPNDDDTDWTLIGGLETEVLEEESGNGPRSASSSSASVSQDNPSLTTQAADSPVTATPRSKPNENEADDAVVPSSNSNANANALASIGVGQSDWVLFLERLRSSDPITQLLILAEALGKIEEALVALTNKEAEKAGIKSQV